MNKIESRSNLTYGVKGFLLIFTPLALAALPLFFHISEQPLFAGPYGRGYFFFMLFLWAAIIALSSYAGFRCALKQSFKPIFPFLAAIFTTAFILIAIEIFLRNMYGDPFAMYAKWGHKKSMFVGYEAKPSHTWTVDGVTYSTEKRGFRTHVTDKEWADKPGPKIFILGGSAVFGFGLNDDETWPIKLEKHLNHIFPDASIYVINAGNNGHNSLQTLIRFYLKVLPMDPYYVIFYGGINDVSGDPVLWSTTWMNEELLFARSMTDYIRAYYKYENRVKNYYMKTMIHWLIAETREKWFPRERKLEQMRDALKILPPPPDQATIKNNAMRFGLNVRTIVEICKAYGIPVTLATFLHDSDFKPDSMMTASLAAYNEKLRGLAAQKQIGLFDLEKDFAAIPNKKDYFFRDHYHPNRQGGDYIAAKVAEGLVAQVRALQEVHPSQSSTAPLTPRND